MVITCAIKDSALSISVCHKGNSGQIHFTKSVLIDTDDPRDRVTGREDTVLKVRGRDLEADVCLGKRAEENLAEVITRKEGQDTGPAWRRIMESERVCQGRNHKQVSSQDPEYWWRAGTETRAARDMGLGAKEPGRMGVYV